MRLHVIPCSRHDPKILPVDDAKIVGDGITVGRPTSGNFLTQEAERRIGELGASGVGFVVEAARCVPEPDEEPPPPYAPREREFIWRDEELLLRIKRPEHLKERDPAAFGRLLGLDRAPEVLKLENDAMTRRIWFPTIGAPFLLMMRGGCGANVIARISNTVAAATKLEGVIKRNT
jgi:hypothetical protein